MERCTRFIHTKSYQSFFLQQKSGTQAIYIELNKNHDEPTSKKKDGMRNLISLTKNGRKLTTTPLIYNKISSYTMVSDKY